jgi:hypothetical protein
MRRALAVAVIGLALLLPAEASGKGGPVVVRLCGASGCTRVAGEPLLLVSLTGTGPELRPTSVPPAQPFYRLELTNEFDQSWSGFLVPRARAVRIGERWLAVSPGDAAQVRPATSRVRPFPRPRLSGVLVDGRSVASPAGYLDVYRRLPKAEFPSEEGGWLRIELRSARPSPWTGPGHDLEYLPSQRVLFRDGEWVQAPASLADRLESDAGLRSGSWSWWPLSAALAAAATAALAALALRRTLRARRRAAIA